MTKEASKSGLEYPLIHCPKNGDAKKWCNQNSEIMTELKKQMRLSGPLVVVSFMQYSLQMISVMFVGRLGELSLASASMATSFAGVTGFTLMLGVGSALETFCGQAYGARQYHMLGVHMQRAMVVLTLLTIPIASLWASTGQIFITLKQDPQVSLHSGIYARWLIPSIVPYGLLQCQTRFLQTQNNVKPLMWSTGLSSLVHVLTCWILIFKLGFGEKGAAFSSAISYWINVVILALYIKYSASCQKTWTGFSIEGMKDLLGFLKLGIPSALMVCLEGWSYELLVFMSGLLPNPELETSMISISMNISAVMFRIPFGFGSSVSTRVLIELGAGRPRAAQLAVKVVMLLVTLQGLSLSLFLVAVRNVWGFLYTNDKQVITYLATVLPVLALSNFVDGFQGVFSGIARGCGWQKAGAFVNLGSYYLVGLPCAIIFTFLLHIGGKGLWMGIMCGSGLQTILLIGITMSTNWEDEAKKAKERVYASNIIEDQVATQVV